jgi:hypothetical protein
VQLTHEASDVGISGYVTRIGNSVYPGATNLVTVSDADGIVKIPNTSSSGIMYIWTIDELGNRSMSSLAYNMANRSAAIAQRLIYSPDKISWTTYAGEYDDFLALDEVTFFLDGSRPSLPNSACYWYKWETVPAGSYAAGLIRMTSVEPTGTLHTDWSVIDMALDAGSFGAGIGEIAFSTNNFSGTVPVNVTIRVTNGDIVYTTTAVYQLLIDSLFPMLPKLTIEGHEFDINMMTAVGRIRLALINVSSTITRLEYRVINITNGQTMTAWTEYTGPFTLGFFNDMRTVRFEVRVFNGTGNTNERSVMITFSKQAYINRIEEALALYTPAGDYARNSYNNYLDALDMAQYAVSSVATTMYHTEVAAFFETLEAAIEELAYIKALRDLLADARAIDTNRAYKSAYVNALNIAIAAADLVVKDDAATKPGIALAYERVLLAMDALGTFDAIDTTEAEDIIEQWERQFNWFIDNQAKTAYNTHIEYLATMILEENLDIDSYESNLNHIKNTLKPALTPKAMNELVSVVEEYTNTMFLYTYESRQLFEAAADIIVARALVTQIQTVGWMTTITGTSTQNAYEIALEKFNQALLAEILVKVGDDDEALGLELLDPTNSKFKFYDESMQIVAKATWTYDADAKLYMNNVIFGETVNGLIAKFAHNTNVFVFDKDDNVVATGTLATGMKLRAMKGSEIIDEVVLCVMGDINGDGRLDGLDINAISRYIALYDTPVSGILAGDLNGDGRVTVQDITIISNAMLGIDVFTIFGLR